MPAGSIDAEFAESEFKLAPWEIVSSTRAPTSALPGPILKDQEELRLRS